VKPLQPPDPFHLQAAQGWMELGNHEEAPHAAIRAQAPVWLVIVTSNYRGSSG